MTSTSKFGQRLPGSARECQQKVGEITKCVWLWQHRWLLPCPWKWMSGQHGAKLNYRHAYIIDRFDFTCGFCAQRARISIYNWEIGFLQRTVNNLGHLDQQFLVDEGMNTFILPTNIRRLWSVLLVRQSKNIELWTQQAPKQQINSRLSASTSASNIHSLSESSWSIIDSCLPSRVWITGWNIICKFSETYFYSNNLNASTLRIQLNP